MDLTGNKLKFIQESIDNIIASPEYTYRSKADIANVLDVKPQYLNAILHGSRNVSDKFLNKFSTCFKINHNDLPQVQEPMGQYKPKNKEECAVCSEKDKLINRLESQINRYEKEMDWLRNQIDCTEESTTKQAG